MRVLLDHCVPATLAPALGQVDSSLQLTTAKALGLESLSNGDLLRAAASAGFDCLLTVDQSLPFQQRSQGPPLAVLVLQLRDTRLASMLPHLADIARALHACTPNTYHALKLA
jgi:hypothetical protein